jgi:hypothetical protein
MVKCSLIEVTTDNRAVIIVGEDPDAEVKTTPRLSEINYENGNFKAGRRWYLFGKES